MSVKARFGFVVEYVAEMEAAKRFYVEVMGGSGRLIGREGCRTYGA